METIADSGVTTPRGFMAGATECGIKKSGPDLCVVYSGAEAAAAGVFTTNRVKAAPVYLCQEHLRDGRAQAIVVNSGNANACTGAQGLSAAREMANLTANQLGLETSEVLVASTGVIGVPLPMEKVSAGLRRIQLSPQGGHEAARAICTTDTVTKESVLRLDVGGKTVTIGGMAKGAGMIHPNMATLLAFITTDAAVDVDFLRKAVREAADASLNMLTIDGDTSTNDTFLVLANGLAGNEPIKAGSPEAAAFQSGLNVVATHLAKAIAKDGEGASKLIEVKVRGAVSRKDARLVARAVAGSNLVKSAVYGSDPNWGRILCAAGYSGAEVDQEKADITIGSVELMHGGVIQPFDKGRAAGELKGPEVFIFVDLNCGDGEATAWGCDLTEGYVVINSKYTT